MLASRGKGQIPFFRSKKQSLSCSLLDSLRHANHSPLACLSSIVLKCISSACLSSTQGHSAIAATCGCRLPLVTCSTPQRRPSAAPCLPPNPAPLACLHHRPRTGCCSLVHCTSSPILGFVPPTSGVCGDCGHSLLHTLSVCLRRCVHGTFGSSRLLPVQAAYDRAACIANQMHACAPDYAPWLLDAAVLLFWPQTSSSRHGCTRVFC